MPFGDNERYDLVIEDFAGASWVRVQCKTARLSNGAISFSTSSTYAHRGGTRRGYRGEADMFGVYSPDLHEVFMVPVDEVGLCEASLRVEDPRKPDASIRWAKDYQLR